MMEGATYSHVFDDEVFELPISRDDHHRRELIELGLRATFALAQENESSPSARLPILCSLLEAHS